MDVHNVDGELTSRDQVRALRAGGRRAICYVNAGAWEDFRSDRARFPNQVLGRPMAGWPGERWLDIRRLDVLMPIMTARMRECVQKGFDAVDPDNVDGYGSDTGFPLTRDDSVRYVKALADAGHTLGLAVGVKNAVETIPEVVASVDFAVNESCLIHDECGSYAPLLAADRPVFHIEYTGSLAEVCRNRPAGFSTLIKDRALSAARQACPV